ncbi:hypothetical protein AB6A40_008560 [Gnathostoma spinigerum]|uniref:Uncharacterized protein n=1 Tax=Gnathostoma spinigerum TaxID=75299 RepID=A0ABD6EWI3_9BILA
MSIVCIHRNIGRYIANSGRLFVRRLVSSGSYERPQMYQLDHVRKRIEFTVPLMFRTRLDYTFYRSDVICEDLILNMHKEGLPQLMNHLGAISVIGQFCFPHIEMEILNLLPELGSGTVRLRWRVKHISLLRALINPRMFSYSYRIKHLHWFDGYSIFFVDGEGLVYKLRIQKVMRDEEGKSVPKTTTQRLAEKMGMLPKPATCSKVWRSVRF